MASWSTRTSRKLTTPEHTDRALDQMTVVRPSHPGKGRGITSSWLLKTIGGLHDSLRREMRRKREAAALVCSNADPGQDQEAQSTLRQSFDSQGDRKPCNGDDHQKPQLAIQQNDGEKIHQTTGTGETGSQELHETLLQNAGSPIHQSSGENGSSSQVLESTRQQKPQTLAIHQINGENMSSSQLIQKLLQQKHQTSAIHEANGENGSSNQFLQRISQQKLPTSAIRQTNGEDGSSRQVLLQQKPHVQTVANHQPNGEKRTSNQLLQKILQQIPHAQVAATHQTNGDNGSSSQVLQKTLQQNPQTSAIHQPHGELENGSLSQVLQKTLQLQHEPQLAFHESDELEANGNQMLLKTLQQEPQSSILQNNGEDRNQVLQTTLRGCNIGDSIQKCEATLQQLHIGAQHHERQPTLQHTLQGEQSTESPQHSDIGKSSQLLESILQQSYRSSGDGYQREINQLAYNGNSNGHIPHIGSGNVHQNLGMVPQPYSMIQNGSQAVHPIFQQSHDHMKNGDLKSRLDFQDHQSGMIHHSGLNQPAYQNGVCNQSQQTSINLTYDGDDNHNRRPSIVREADIQYLQRMGQWMNPRTFSPDPSSPAKTSGFVGPKQETVDGVVMEGPGVKDFFGAGSDLVSPCFSSGLVNNVPLPTRTPHVAPGMCNSLLSRGPRDVWWNPPVLPTDGGTSGESASAQQTTAAFHQFENGYLPIAGLVTPISAPLPQMPSEHAPHFTDADVYGASPQSHLGSSSILPMPMASESQDQWVGPSPRTEPNTSPYITADLVSRMPSRVSGPVKTRFTDKTSRSFRIHQMQHVQHPGAVTAVDFFKPPRGPPGTYFPNNEASSPHATIASAKHVHKAVPDAPAAAIPLQNAQSLNFPPRPLTLQEALQLSPSETNFPLQNSSHFPMPLPPLLQSVTPASIQAAALGLSWPRASPIVPKLEISSPQDLFTTPGAAVLNALPTASLIKSGSVQPYFPAQPLAASSILNAPFPQVSHRRKEGSEPAAAVACNKIQGGVRAINLDSKDHQILKRMRAGDKRVRFEGDDEHHRQRKQRQQVGVLSSRAIATFDSKDVLQKQIAEEWRMFRRVTRKKLEGRNVEQNQSDTKELAIRKMNGFNHEREQHARKQRKRWKLLRRNGMIHRGIEELIKSASRQANVIVANHEVDKEGRKLLQRRNWLLGDVSNNADSEGNVEQKRQWMLVRIRLLQTLILWKKARYRARLLTHPLFPHLLKAHVDCIRVMTPACKIRDITMQLQRAQRFFEKFLRFAPRRPCEDSRRFDLYLKKFLVQMKNFQDHLECQLKLHATPTYSRLWRIERALFQMTGTRIPGRLESGPTMSDELEDGSDVDSVENISAAAARINYANIKRVIDTRYYGAYGPTVPDRAIMETIRREMVESLGLAHYRRKIREVREEILRKRRAGKLPEGTTNILRAWWEAHAKWPYPTEDEKELLIKKTGLELKQVNNWFINQRKRNWHNNPLATSNRDKRKYPLAELIQV